MNLLAKFLKVLNSEASPWQIAIAITLGMVIGLTPLLRLHNIIILFVVLFLRINLASFLASIVFFSGIAWLFDPLMASVGENVLTASSWQDSWTTLFNSSLGQLSQFNHTLTMGGFLVSLLLAPIVLILSRFIVLQYRQRIMTWVNKLKIMQAFKASKLYQLYLNIGG
ncbi:DUF2062 domain-containing protein [Neptunicella sp. SCSIO 80796]|uniref:DUF2062 domain-containing protein n=1 Tax=Neptunicella plasticusilytica TaxID=3117012 RepID=UPI003A4D68C5